MGPVKDLQKDFLESLKQSLTESFTQSLVGSFKPQGPLFYTAAGKRLFFVMARVCLIKSLTEHGKGLSCHSLRSLARQGSLSRVLLEALEPLFNTCIGVLNHICAVATQKNYISSMPRLTIEQRLEVRFRIRSGQTDASIAGHFQKQGLKTCRQTIWRLRRHSEKHGHIKPLPTSGRPTKLTSQVLEVIESTMKDDDETTAK